MATIDFYRGGQLLFSSTNILGLVGLYTGFKPGKFSVSENERDSLHRFGKWGYAVELVRVWRGARPISWLIRDTLSNAPDFESAVRSMSSSLNLIAPG